MTRARFRARIVPAPRGDGGAFVHVPPEAAAELGLKGMPKISALLAGRPYRGSLMPLGGGAYGLGILNAIQMAAGVTKGDLIDVELWLDTELRIVEPPADLARLLASDPRAKMAWEGMSYTARKEMARGISDAKKRETRERRLAAAAAELRSKGKPSAR